MMVTDDRPAANGQKKVSPASHPLASRNSKGERTSILLQKYMYEYNFVGNPRFVNTRTVSHHESRVRGNGLVNLY